MKVFLWPVSTVLISMMLTLLLLFSASSSDALAHTTTKKTTTNPIISASTDEKNKRFDFGCVANPVILPPTDKYPKWQCYYYGNSGSWNCGQPCFLPTGSSGLAESDDGITNWIKIDGIEEEKAILTPGKVGEWDSIHTGVADVIRVNDELHMYYFGGSEEEIKMGPGSIAGFRMRIGRAKSTDNGRTWVKDDTYVLDYDENEGFFASWPRIIVPQENNKEEPWKMFYHAFNGKKWKVYSATSSDMGDTWQRTGLVITGNEDDEDAFDYQGIGTRDIIHWKDGSLLMIYEGVNKAGTHSLGAACYSNKWEKLNNGKPILEPGKGILGKWTTQVIGTPYIVPLDDGVGIRLYHCGKENSNSKMSIGVVESKSGNIEPDCWEAIA
mmetsp:Transcript_22146/g.25217  ORF Transcript_22146/g.25217 Transcript_22146/m.25217 type:complete len:383 (+) Transcript_22146:99-1247(+)